MPIDFVIKTDIFVQKVYLGNKTNFRLCWYEAMP